jgi:hypothetical protein
MNKKIIIPVDVLNYDIEVIITDDVCDAIVKLDKENNDKNNSFSDVVSGFEEAFSFYCDQYKDGLITKRIGMILDQDVSETVLMHECLHTAWYTLEHVGIDVTWDSHEMLALLQGSLYVKIKAKILKCN